MPMNLQATYNGMTGRRDRYLGYAEDIARLTFPQMSPRGTIITERPYTSAGTQAVKSLSSFMLKIMMPHGVRWGEYDLPVNTWTLIRQILEPEVIEDMENRLDARSTDALQSLNRKKSRSRISAAILRNLIEGSTGIFNTQDQIRVYPLRAHVVEREAGEIRLALFLDIVSPSPLDTMGGSGKDNAVKHIYTMVDYAKGEVWRQTDSDAPRRIQDESPHQWFVFSAEIPDVDDYAVGYAYNYIRLIAQIDHAESSLAEALADAAFNPLGVKTGTPLAFNLDQIRNRRTGDPLVMSEGDIFRLSIGAKLADWRFVVGMRNDDKQELAEVFAQGIKDRPISQDTSATAVIEIIDEINTQASDVLTAYNETLQVALLRSELVLLELVEPLFPDLGAAAVDIVNPIVTTGITALERQRSLQRFVGMLGPLKSLDPERFIVNSGPIADEISKGMLLESDDFWSVRSDQQIQLEQLAAIAQAQNARAPAGGGQTTANGEGPRTETILTRGGPQPPQGAPPRPQ